MVFGQLSEIIFKAIRSKYLENTLKASTLKLEIVVNLVVVNFFGFVAITRHQEVGFRRKLGEILPTDLRELSKPFGTSKTKKTIRDQKFEKIKKISTTITV